jgi:lipooligosaccharide transport system permease protein
MPVFLQWIGWISPLWHSTNFARSVSFGLAVPGWLMIIHVAFLTISLVAGMVIARKQFEGRLLK